jgi:hypothetical protein
MRHSIGMREQVRQVLDHLASENNRRRIGQQVASAEAIDDANLRTFLDQGVGHVVNAVRRSNDSGQPVVARAALSSAIAGRVRSAIPVQDVIAETERRGLNVPRHHRMPVAVSMTSRLERPHNDTHKVRTQ